jgi:HAD superfamily hydrolase (TIGR01509 family)
MSTDAVIFDVGGVLAQNIWEHMLPALAEWYGLDRAEIEDAGKLLWETFAYVGETPANLRGDMEVRYWKLFLAIFRRQLQGKDISVESLIALTDDFIVPIEGMAPILESLKSRGTTLVICSNNNEFWQPRQMAKLGLQRYFPESKEILSTRVGAPKDSPRFEMFRAALAAAGVPASRCLFVDDRPENVARAQEFGIDAVLFKDAAGLTRELRQRGIVL